MRLRLANTLLRPVNDREVHQWRAPDQPSPDRVTQRPPATSGDRSVHELPERLDTTHSGAPVPALCYQPTKLPHLYPLNGALGRFTRGGSYSVVFQSCSAVFESYSVAFQSCSAVFESYSVVFQSCFAVFESYTHIPSHTSHASPCSSHNQSHSSHAPRLRRVRVIFRRIPVMLHHTPVWPCCERLNRRTSGPAATMRALSVGSQL